MDPVLAAFIPATAAMLALMLAAAIAYLASTMRVDRDFVAFLPQGGDQVARKADTLRVQGLGHAPILPRRVC